VNGLRYKDRASGEEQRLELAGVFVQIGLVPNTEWLKGTVELSRSARSSSTPRAHQRARCVCGRRLTTVPFKQIVIAAGEGAKAALSAFDHLIRTPAHGRFDQAFHDQRVAVGDLDPP
jgi:alkyl hydroperoxide reductase subunit F